MSPAPGRAARIGDALALLIVLAGVAMYIYASNGMHDLATNKLVHPEGNLMTNEYVRFARMEIHSKRIIIAGVGVGLVSFAYSAWSGRRRGT